MFGTDFGAGSLTDSGYPRIVKLWKRGSGVPLTSAQTIFEGTAKDVSVSPVILRGTNKTHALLVRSVDFYQSEYRYVSADGSTFKLPLSEWADVKGMTGGQMLATLRKDWQPEGQANIPQGSLVAFPLEDYRATRQMPRVAVLFTPEIGRAHV